MIRPSRHHCGSWSIPTSNDDAKQKEASLKLITFDEGGPSLRIGAILSDTEVLDIDIALVAADIGSGFGDMIGLIEAGSGGLDSVTDALQIAPGQAIRQCSDIRLCAPIPKPPRLRDTLMFIEHMENGLRQWASNLAKDDDDPEAKVEELMATGRYSVHPVFKEQVIYYNANHLTVSGHDEIIHWPGGSAYADFELEFAVVIGQASRAMSREEAKSAIFGYTIFNDWSARDLQLEFMKANLGPAGGKDFAGSNTLGPCIVTADEISAPYALAMEARVNGEIWSRGTTASMHHHFETAIAQFSRYEDLVPGEVIGSGTVLHGCGYELGRKLADGDVVELTVEGIGTLRNQVRTATSGVAK
jgi:2-keto-4-pentenoate hydratase/2-oxohepta-3-ene-1,7-dioic acid hydratase in catechol pathway